MSWRTGATEALSGSDLVSYILAAKHDSCVLDQDLIAGVPGPGELRLASDSSKMAVCRLYLPLPHTVSLRALQPGLKVLTVHSQLL